MLFCVRYPYLCLYPETPAEVSLISETEWILPGKRGDWYRSYWTRIIDAHLLFQLRASAPKELESIKKLMSVRSDLRHYGDSVPPASVVLPSFSKRYQPRPYQLLGIDYIKRVRRLILADMTGLGKTIQSAGALLYDSIATGSVGINIVVCPSGIRYQWRSEISSMFVVPGSEDPAFDNGSVSIIDGSVSYRESVYRATPKDFVIINYELLRKDREKFLAWILESDVPVHGVILDEGSRFKNPESATYKTVEMVVRKLRPKLVMCLNATPIENNLSDLWAQLSIICPEIFPSLRAFEERYVQKRLVKLRNSFRTIEKVVGHRHLDEVRDLMRDRYVRRSYEDVSTDLPEVVVINRIVHLGREQLEQYESVQNDKSLDPMVRIGELVRRALFAEEPFRSAKLDAFLELADEFGDSKVVVVSESKVFVKQFVQELRSAGKSVVMITGDMSDSEREMAQRTFVKGSAQYLVGTSAIERGLNLQAAEFIVNMDLPWNPAKLLQRVGRVRRIGSKHAAVRVVNIIAAATVETKILRTIYEKNDLFSTIFREDAKLHYASKGTIEAILNA